MGLLSYFKRNPAPAGEPTAAAPDPVENARTRARRRLIGATVLLGIAVVGFPLVFESQPRPIPVDIPIEIPRREGAPALVVPPAPGAAAPRAPALPPPEEQPPASGVLPGHAMPELPVETAAEQGREVPPNAASAAAPPASRARAAAVARTAASVAASSARAASAPAPRSPVAAHRADDGQRARALLEGGGPAATPAAPVSASASTGVRVVVQVGAYTDAEKLREARARVEKLGFKTYTQVVEADGGKRTRVRVGPFASRDDATKAAARIRAAGLPVAILAL